MSRKHIVSVEQAKKELLDLGYKLHVRSSNRLTYIEATVRVLARKATETSPKVEGQMVLVSHRPSPDERQQHASLYDWLDRNAVADGSKIAVFE